MRVHDCLAFYISIYRIIFSSSCSADDDISRHLHLKKESEQKIVIFHLFCRVSYKLSVILLGIQISSFVSNNFWCVSRTHEKRQKNKNQFSGEVVNFKDSKNYIYAVLEKSFNEYVHYYYLYSIYEKVSAVQIQVST